MIKKFKRNTIKNIYFLTSMEDVRDTSYAYEVEDKNTVEDLHWHSFRDVFFFSGGVIVSEFYFKFVDYWLVLCFKRNIFEQILYQPRMENVYYQKN